MLLKPLETAAPSVAEIEAAIVEAAVDVLAEAADRAVAVVAAGVAMVAVEDMAAVAVGVTKPFLLTKAATKVAAFSFISEPNIP